MQILVLNCGSATLKFDLLELRGNGGSIQHARGSVDRLGQEARFRARGPGGPEIERVQPLPDHHAAER